MIRRIEWTLKRHCERGSKEGEGCLKTRMVTQEDPKEGTPNAEVDAWGPAQSEADCGSVL
jgi:hypothetical protein